jgi:hypothetical protein
MKKKLALIFLMTFSIGTNVVNAQTEFAPVGAEWYYSNNMWILQGYLDYEKYHVENDTVIEGHVCKIVTGRFQNATGGHLLTSTIFRQDNEKIYHYFNNQFHLIYDFGVNVGDTAVFSIPQNDTQTDSLMGIAPLRCVIDSIVTKIVNGEELKMVFSNIIFDDTLGFTSCNTYNYMEKIGNLHVFMEKYENLVTLADYLRELRCYEDEIINYRSDWFSKYDLECDHTGYIGIANFNKIYKIYPNPVSDILIIEADGVTDVCIYDITGKSLFYHDVNANSDQLNVSFLPSGLYILQIKYADNKLTYHKIIKKN